MSLNELGFGRGELHHVFAKPITISWQPWGQHFASADHEERMGDPRKLQKAVWDDTSLVGKPWCQGCNAILQPSVVQGRYPSGSWTPLTLLIMAAVCHHGIWSTRGRWQKCKRHKKALELWRPSPLLCCLVQKWVPFQPSYNPGKHSCSKAVISLECLRMGTIGQISWF